MIAPRAFVGLMAVGLAVSTLFLWPNHQPRAAAADPPLQHRLFVGALARDHISGSPPLATASPSQTPSLTPSVTATPTSTATPSPTPTATSSSGSARALVQAWYDHINLVLYPRYASILAQHASGQLSSGGAGSQLTAEKANADAFKLYLDGQASALFGASAQCGQARQTLGLASGWLALMEGWGGLILTYGATSEYLTNRQTAADNYFAFMTQSLGLIASCTGSASAVGSLPVPSAPPPTPTPTPTPTPPGGGGYSCFGSRTTPDWQIQVSPALYSGDLFDVVVRPLTDEALEVFAIKVRVYDPSYFSADSGNKYPSFIGQSLRFSYGFDFFESAPYLAGTYEVQLRIDFATEARVYVTCP